MNETTIKAAMSDAAGGVKRILGEIGGAVAHGLQIAIPEIERAAQLQREAVDKTTGQIVAQIDAAVSELQSMREHLVQSAEASKRAIEAHAMLGTNMAHTTALLRQAFQPTPNDAAAEETAASRSQAGTMTFGAGGSAFTA